MTQSYLELQNDNQKLQQEMLQLCGILEAKDQEIAANSEKISSLEHMVNWFRRQLFGAKTERRLMTEQAYQQLPLFAALETPETPPPAEEPTQKIKEYERKQRKTKIAFVAEDSKLKFTADVPVKTIEVSNPEVEGLIEGIDYNVINENVTYKLAQTKSPYVVLKYVQKVVVLKETKKILKPALPTPVIEKSIADVSFLAAMVVEKYSFHLPLYRQHQRLIQSGIHVSRSTLTKLIHPSGRTVGADSKGAFELHLTKRNSYH